MSRERIHHALRHRASLAAAGSPSAAAITSATSLRIGQRPELDEPGAVAEPSQELRRDLHRETGLAHTTDARERDDARVLERLDDDRAMSSSRPTNDVIWSGRFVGNASSERSGGKSRRERGMHDLEDPLGLPEVAQAVLAEIDELDARASRTSSLGRERHHDLAAVRDRHQPRRAVQRGAVVVAVADLGRARMDAHAHPQRPGRRPRLGRERELAATAASTASVGGRERGVEPVAGRLHHMAAVAPRPRRAAISS